jgi:hypothetical protein
MAYTFPKGDYSFKYVYGLKIKIAKETDIPPPLIIIQRPKDVEKDDNPYDVYNLSSSSSSSFNSLDRI